MARKRKVNKRKSPSRTVLARKRRAPRRRSVTRVVRRAASGRGKLGSILKRGIVGDTVAAIGAGVVVGGLAQRVAPQAAPFASIAGEFLAGGATGTIVAELIKPAFGMPSILGNLGGIFGGGNGGQSVGAMV